VYSPAKPKAGFGTKILTKAMMANTTTSTNAGEELPPKSGERILIEGGADPWQLFMFLPPPLPPNLRPSLEVQSS